jgi:uncharacterized membrane protein YjdF
MLYRYLGKTVALTAWQQRVATVLLIIGMGAIHELVEWFSTLILGPKHGMLKTEGVYEFDTQRDMFDNLLGAIVAVALYAVAHRRARRAAAGGVRSGKPEAPGNGDSRAAAPPLESRLKEGSVT